jgi:ABC-2 type transport system ATP-binding protein
MIEARHLVKRYGSTVAVNDLSFSIRPGLVTGFLGPNGAGKTTTMRMILGLDAPTPVGSELDTATAEAVTIPPVGAPQDAVLESACKRAATEVNATATQPQQVFTAGS